MADLFIASSISRVSRSRRRCSSCIMLAWQPTERCIHVYERETPWKLAAQPRRPHAVQMLVDVQSTRGQGTYLLIRMRECRAVLGLTVSTGRTCTVDKAWYWTDEVCHHLVDRNDMPLRRLLRCRWHRRLPGHFRSRHRGRLIGPSDAVEVNSEASRQEWQ
jgi:hypothetical protein